MHSMKLEFDTIIFSLYAVEKINTFCGEEISSNPGYPTESHGIN